MLFEESNEKQSEAKKADNDNDNVNDNVNEKDNKKHLCTAEAAALFERLWKLYPVKKAKDRLVTPRRRSCWQLVNLRC